MGDVLPTLQRNLSIDSIPLHPHRLATRSLSQRLIREAEEQLAAWAHPDPYVNPYMAGGSRFMRNPALPLNVRGWW